MLSQTSFWNKLAHSIRSLFRREQIETELDSELRFHLESQIESNIRAGMSPEEARRSAMREFGGVELAKEECRDERGTQFLDQLWQDMRFGVRMLRKNPGFTAVAVLTLALGIGANSAIFGLIDTVLLRPLPVPHPNQLFLVQWKSHQEPLQDQVRVGVCDEDNHVRESTGCGFSYATFDTIRENATSVAAIAATNSGEKVHTSLGGGTEHTPAFVDYTSGNFFEVLQVPAFLGRTFVLEDDRLGASPVAIISYNLWRERFGSDPNALGRLIYVEDAAFTVVGVAPQDFPGVSQIHPADLWIPIHAIAQIKRESSAWTSPDSSRSYLAVIARLKPNVARAPARLALTSLYRVALANDPQHSFAAGAPPEIILSDFSRGAASYIRELFSQPLVILMMIVSCVLLIACANIASLNLARASKRRAEIAVRFALGAGRGRLLRQLFTESFLLAIAGRDVDPADLRKDSGVVWINHNLAQHIFPGENAVGKLLRLRKWCTVAGVVGDTKYNSVRDDMPETIYEPLPNIWPASHIMIHTAGDPAALATAVRDVVRRNAPDATVYSVKTESQMLDKSLFYERLMARLSLVFGLLALLLTCVGVYGVLAYATAQRTGEIAIRISLGATPSDILRLIVTDGLRPAIAGAIIGLAGCFALTHLLTKFLYGIQPFDPATFCVATLLLIAVAAFACYFPARRATRIDPMTALRNE